jgi:hypothetical protein
VEPAVEVLRASVEEQLPGAIAAARLRLPRPADSTDVFAFPLAGMVLPREGHVQSVEIVCAGEIVKEIAADHPRRGVQRRFPDLPDALNCGFGSMIGTLPVPPEFELDLFAKLDDGSRVRFASIVGRRSVPTPSYEPTLRPLVLTSPGRSGTVWMMRMLAAHPGVVVHPHPEHEVWPGRYWAHLLAVLSGPADPRGSVTSRSFEYLRGLVGQNPYYDTASISPASELGSWLGRTHVDRLASFCMQNIDDWYSIVAQEQAKQPVYFAEKNFPRTALQGLSVTELYPGAREVFLVRDFRDMACSYLAYAEGHWWSRRGYDADRILREFLEPWVRNVLSGWRSRRAPAVLVRYEDLVLSPRETIDALLRFLELDASDETVDSMLGAAPQKVFEHHGTSTTLDGSVGRWRNEPGELRDRLDELFADALAEFGYTETVSPLS